MKNDRGWLPGEREADWIESLARPLSGALAAIEAAATEGSERIPIVDRDSGRVLAALAAGRRRIVEVGTAFGYSTLWLALGQGSAGTIVTIDPDRSRTDRARGWWREAGVDDARITVVTSKALEAFAANEPALAGPFDLAYVNHPAKLPEIAINVFWHAKVHKDPANEWLRGLVFRIHSD